MTSRDDPTMRPAVPAHRPADHVTGATSDPALRPTESSESAEGESGYQPPATVAQFGDLQSRVVTLGTLALGVGIDLAFLIVWAALQKAASYAFDWLGDLTDTTGTFQQIMEYVFDGATLLLVLAYVVRDLWLSLLKLWRPK